MMPVVPVELWIKIIRQLPSHYQRSCLSVSKLFHDISLQYVFASIDVRLGLLKDNHLADQDQCRTFENEEQMEAEAGIRRSCELLQRIVRSPRSDLAQAVRHVSVRAYSYDGESIPKELLGALAEALSVLRLRGFAWYGCHPMPRQQVFEALFTASGETLEEIVLPADLELVDHTPVFMFPHLKSLSFLNRYGNSLFPYFAVKSSSGYLNSYRAFGVKAFLLDSMRETISEASSSLRSLGIFGEVFWKCNVQHFSALVDLTLILLTDIGPLGTIFTPASQLRSLTLYVRGHCPGNLAFVLRAHSDALPLLTAFRLSYPNLARDDAEATAAFLQKKPLLERLDLGHPSHPPYLDDIQPVLEILPELPRLRVLGHSLVGSRDSPWLTRDTLLHLGRYLPRGLTALSLWVAAPGFSTVTEADWIQLFGGLQSCRFIYAATDSEYSGTLELHSALLEHPPPSAELVGFNVNLSWAKREPETGRVAYGECWPLSKVYYRTAQEFGREEWEWLLKDLDSRLVL